MAVMNQFDLEEGDQERARENSTSDALISEVPQIPGIECVRGISPLVMTALHKANNPYVVGKRGFELLGVKFTEEGKIEDLAAFGVAMNPKTAEVLVLWTCDRQELKKFAMDSSSLQDAALDYMEDFPGGIEGMAAATEHVTKALQAVQLAKAVASDAEDKPKASTMTGEGTPGPKKHARIGGLNS